MCQRNRKKKKKMLKTEATYLIIQTMWLPVFLDLCLSPFRIQFSWTQSNLLSSKFP
jgi:hypothetical protein